MKERILRKWNFQRVLYPILGMVIIIQSAIQHEWAGILLGGYFAAMGIFAFGCAAGNCFTDTTSEASKNDLAKYEEIKHY